MSDVLEYEVALYGGVLDGSTITLVNDDDIGTYTFRQLILERNKTNRYTGYEYTIEYTYVFDHYDTMNDMPVFKWTSQSVVE